MTSPCSIWIDALTCCWGGRDYFAADKRKDKRDLGGEFAAAGWAQCPNPPQIFGKGPVQPTLVGHLPGTPAVLVDQVGGITPAADIPSLADMAGAALKKLSVEPHFILQVEGGRVTMGATTTTRQRRSVSWWPLTKPSMSASAFQKSPRRWIIITTDHSTANPGLLGWATTTSRVLNSSTISARSNNPLQKS